MKVYIHDDITRNYINDAIKSVEMLGLDYVVVSPKDYGKNTCITPKEYSYSLQIASCIKNEIDDIVILEDDDILIRKPQYRPFSYHVQPFIIAQSESQSQNVLHNVTMPWHNVSSMFINSIDLPKVKYLFFSYNDGFGLDAILYYCLQMKHYTDPNMVFTAWRYHGSNQSFIHSHEFYIQNEKRLSMFLKNFCGVDRGY